MSTFDAFLLDYIYATFKTRWLLYLFNYNQTLIICFTRSTLMRFLIDPHAVQVRWTDL